MPPTIRQRLILTVAIAVGGLVWACAADVLGAPDGSSGLSLVSSRLGLAPAIAVAVTAGLGAVALGLVVAAVCQPISGVLAVAGALCILAATGGSAEGWLRRSQLPGDYGWLIVEVLIWQVWIVALLLLIRWLHLGLRNRWAAITRREHGDDSSPVPVGGPNQPIHTVGAAVICAAIAVAGGHLLIRNNDTGQVICSLLVAFAVGAVIALAIFPRAAVTGILFSPALVAIAAYSWVLLRFEDNDQVLAAWYLQEQMGSAAEPMLPTLALILPIHFASAALAGCCIGIKMGQSATSDQGEPQGALAAVYRALTAKDDDKPPHLETSSSQQSSPKRRRS